MHVPALDAMQDLDDELLYIYTSSGFTQFRTVISQSTRTSALVQRVDWEVQNTMKWVQLQLRKTI